MGCFGKPAQICHNGHECVAATDSRAASNGVNRLGAFTFFVVFAVPTRMGLFAFLA
jgi:hypothetical protein